MLNIQTAVDISQSTFNLSTDLFGSDEIEIYTDKLAYAYVLVFPEREQDFAAGLDQGDVPSYETYIVQPVKIFIPFEAQLVANGEKLLYKVRAVSIWNKLKTAVLWSGGKYTLGSWPLGKLGTDTVKEGILSACSINWYHGFVSALYNVFGSDNAVWVFGEKDADILRLLTAYVHYDFPDGSLDTVLRYTQKILTARVNAPIEYMPMIYLRPYGNDYAVTYAVLVTGSKVTWLGEVARTRTITKYKLRNYTVDFSDTHAGVRVLTEAENLPVQYPSKFLWSAHWTGREGEGSWEQYNGYWWYSKNSKLVDNAIVKTQKKTLTVLFPDSYKYVEQQSAKYTYSGVIYNWQALATTNPFFVYPYDTGYCWSIVAGYNSYQLSGTQYREYVIVQRILRTTGSGTAYFGKKFAVPYKVSGDNYYFKTSETVPSQVWALFSDTTAQLLNVYQSGSDYYVTRPAGVSPTIAIILLDAIPTPITFAEQFSAYESGFKYIVYGNYPTKEGMLRNQEIDSYKGYIPPWKDPFIYFTEPVPDAPYQSFVAVVDDVNKPYWLDYPYPVLDELIAKEQYLNNILTNPIETLEIETTEYADAGDLADVKNFGTFRVVRASYKYVGGKFVQGRYELQRRGQYYPTQLDTNLQGVIWDEVDSTPIVLKEKKLIQ